MDTTGSDATRAIISQAFDDDRAFPFHLADDIVSALSSGSDTSAFRDRFAAIRDGAYAATAENDTVASRLDADARLTHVFPVACAVLHELAASHPDLNLTNRRYVLIQPVPTGRHGGETPPLVVHSGPGPSWVEIPSVYLDLRLFDLVDTSVSADEREMVEQLTLIEERSVENGFNYLPYDLDDKSEILQALTRRLLEPTVPEKPLRERPAKPIPPLDIEELYERLDRRIPGDELNFDYEAVMEAVGALERYARLAKESSDEETLHSVIALLVASSGHDLHDARDRANIALERIFSPKEYDAPPATEFRTVQTGSEVRLEFALPPTGGDYVVKLYLPDAESRLTTDGNLHIEEIPLRPVETDHHEAAASSSGATAQAQTVQAQAVAGSESYRLDRYQCSFTADSPGFVDYLVAQTDGARTGGARTDEQLPSGRVHILPDVTGDIVLQIFPDIHGHTRVYWKDGDGHPGLVYNEAGEVIRLGNLDDVTAHLEDLKERYQISGIYLLGVQTRGTNREDWAEGATSPSPFSPVSLTRIEPSLGGPEAFKRLVSRAHDLDIRVIVDIMPHLNRQSQELPPELTVNCYDAGGQLVERASTDGRFGSWNDGKLLNYRRFEVWEWFARSITTLVEEYGIDGVRIDTAHAVPIMMKRNNFPYIYDRSREHSDMVHGTIIVNDREDDHLITTGYYDSACRDRIACPFYTFLNRYTRPVVSKARNDYFVILAECYWGREQYLARSGVVPYNSALFKICENITHGTTDVTEVYHLYDHYYAQALPRGTVMIGIFGNHDERRALNTFGERGLRAAIALTAFVSSIILDYEGSAEGESWKVFMDNIFVNWNQFEIASHRSLERFYRETYLLHRNSSGPGKLLWTENHLAAAAIKPRGEELWIGAFSFSGDTQSVTLHFDAPQLPIEPDELYRLIDPVYSSVTGNQGYYAGFELVTTTVHTVVPYTDRVKYLVLEKRPASEIHLAEVFRDSFHRIRYLHTRREFRANLAFRRLGDNAAEPRDFVAMVRDLVLPVSDGDTQTAFLALKRVLYHVHEEGVVEASHAFRLIETLREDEEEPVSRIGERLAEENSHGPFVFISAEADPFSKSGGLANVVYELPRQLAAEGEEVYVVTPKYRHGTEQAMEKMKEALDTYDVRYTGRNVRFFIEGAEYEVGVHSGRVGEVTYFMLDHYEFFDGLYWGYTAEERLRRRVGLARASAELIAQFELAPLFVFTNDAYAGVFTGIVRGDPYYAHHPTFRRASYFHIIHNGGWQYFDAYSRYEGGKDLFSVFNLPFSEAHNFADPVHPGLINCMAAGVRYADKSFTVSPSYAAQIRSGGDGLERILDDIVGINNAIAPDYARRARYAFKESGVVEDTYETVLRRISERDALHTLVEERYPEILTGPHEPETISSKRRREIVVRFRDRLAVQTHFGLDPDPDALLCTMLHRVADQKGYQLLLECSQGLIEHLGVQLVVGGPVNWDDDQSRALAVGLEQLSHWYPGRVAARLGFQDVRIPLLGSDAFLMPSRHEPGGISQLEALACGCPVIARATGGLMDTVVPLRTEGRSTSGNGILFTDYTAGAFYDAVVRFAEIWRGMSDEQRRTARNKARTSVYYWDRPAGRYIHEAYAHREIIHPRNVTHHPSIREPVDTR